MNEKFLKEWEDHFGKTELGPSDDNQDVNHAMFKQNLQIKRKVEELEYTSWHLYDAYESVNVYAD